MFSKNWMIVGWESDSVLKVLKSPTDCPHYQVSSEFLSSNSKYTKTMKTNSLSSLWTCCGPSPFFPALYSSCSNLNSDGGSLLWWRVVQHKFQLQSCPGVTLIKGPPSYIIFGQIHSEAYLQSIQNTEHLACCMSHTQTDAGSRWSCSQNEQNKICLILWVRFDLCLSLHFL